MKYRLRNTFFFSLLLVFLFACSNEEPDGLLPGDTKTVDFRLMLSASQEENSQNTTQYEGMRNILVVITDNDGKILQREEEDLQWEEGKEAILEEGFSMEVPKEAAYVYAFSNLNSPLLENNENILEALEVGKTLPVSFDEQGILNGSIPDAKIKNDVKIVVDEQNSIPMSSHPHKLESEMVEIPLYRMIAKVKMSIENKTAGEVAVSKMTLEKFQNDRKIYMLPYKSLENIKEEDIPLFPDNDATEFSDVDKIFFEQDEESSFELATADKREAIFYVHESMLDGQDNIKVQTTIQRQEEKEQNLTGVTHFTYVRRNDLLIIPLVISDYSLEVTVSEQQAPIGGYPFTYEMSLVPSLAYSIKNSGELTIKLALIQQNLDGTGGSGVQFTTKDWQLTSDGNDAITWKDSQPNEGDEVTQVTLMVHKQGSAQLSFTAVTENNKEISYTIELIYK